MYNCDSVFAPALKDFGLMERFSRRINLALTALLLSFFTIASFASQLPLSSRTDVDTFIDNMVQRYHFKKDDLAALFDKVELHPEIIKSITKPYEAKPWYEYEELFINEPRIKGGVKFWKKHQSDLARAQKRYGVPASMIVAIIGVETIYGQRQGKYRVIDALTTLSFNYPRRAKFFQKELREFLLLTRDEKMDPLSPLGSYAGAMGQPQFMPSSYRSYAVDFTGNGKKDLVNDSVDVIGSVANYFAKHGWVRGQPIAMPVSLQGNGYKSLLTNNKRHHTSYKPNYSVAQLKQHGVKPAKSVSNKLRAALLEFQDEKAKEYWLGFTNFYVITRYNSSKQYAMAAYQLSQKIESAYQEETKQTEKKAKT